MIESRPPEPPDGEESVDPYEVVDGLPVLVEARPIEPAGQATTVVALAQAAAVAATGFVAGVATAAVLGRRRQRRLTGLAPVRPALPSPAQARPPAQIQVTSSRSYLVDVHIIERRG